MRFCGHAQATADHCVELTTTPHAPPTHWCTRTLALARARALALSRTRTLARALARARALAASAGHHLRPKPTRGQGALTRTLTLTLSPRRGQSALLLDPLPLSTSFTVGLTSCSRSQHDLNFTVGYDGRHASYSISSDFRGYKELDNFDDDDAEEADAADAGTAADDGADYDE